MGSNSAVGLFAIAVALGLGLGLGAAPPASKLALEGPAALVADVAARLTTERPELELTSEARVRGRLAAIGTGFMLTVDVDGAVGPRRALGPHRVAAARAAVVILLDMLETLPPEPEPDSEGTSPASLVAPVSTATSTPKLSNQPVLSDVDAPPPPPEFEPVATTTVAAVSKTSVRLEGGVAPWGSAWLGRAGIGIRWKLLPELAVDIRANYELTLGARTTERLRASLTMAQVGVGLEGRIPFEGWAPFARLGVLAMTAEAELEAVDTYAGEAAPERFAATRLGGELAVGLSVDIDIVSVRAELGSALYAPLRWALPDAYAAEGSQLERGPLAPYAAVGVEIPIF